MKLAFFAALLAAPLSAQGIVWRVDASPAPAISPDFTTVQEAVAAASSGDTIAIVPGIYPETVVVAGKALNLTSTSTSEVPRISGLEVSGVHSGAMALRSILVSGSSSITDCSAPILVEGTEFVLLSSVTDCDDLVLTRCEVLQTLALVDSSAALFSCEVRGQVGTPGQIFGCFADDLGEFIDGVSGGTGHPGLEILRGDATLVGCDVFGGPGGQGGFGFVSCPLSGPQEVSTFPGSGGPGMEVLGGAIVREFGCEFTGALLFNPFGGGVNAPGIVGNVEHLPSVPGGGVASTPADVRSTEGSSPMQNGGTTDFTFRGIPGDVVYLQYSTGVSPSYVSALSGVWVTQPSGFLLSPGVVPASGELAVTFGVTIPLVNEFELFHGQGFFVRAIQGNVVVWAGAPTSVTVLQ